MGTLIELCPENLNYNQLPQFTTDSRRVAAPTEQKMQISLSMQAFAVLSSIRVPDRKIFKMQIEGLSPKDNHLEAPGLMIDFLPASEVGLLGTEAILSINFLPSQR